MAGHDGRAVTRGVDPHARRFTDAQIDALWAAIQVNDVIADVDAPSIRPSLDYDRARLIDGFGISRQLWQDGFDRDALLALVRTLGRGGHLDGEEQRRFKHIRAKFKHLRFAFVLYGADHRCPPTFKAVTTSMGFLQDAFKGGDTTAVRRHAAVLRLLLTRLPCVMLRREVDRLRPCHSSEYRDFVLKQIAMLRVMLATPAMTGHQFHAARKIVSRQVSFHDDMRAIADHAEHRAMSAFLSAINGMMGRAHDALVRDRADGGGDYARAGLVLQPDLRRRLTVLVDLYPARPGTSNSTPRSR